MSEPDNSPELQEQIQAATDAGEHDKAQALYERQQGVSDEAAAQVPAVSDTKGADPPQASTGGLVVATTAHDDTATITGGMDFAGNPDHVAHALACMEVWGEDEVAPLKAEWGSDMGANLGFFQAFALAHPDVHEILVASGFGDHPAIIRVGAMLGRRYATKGGDPSQITTKKAGVKAVEHMATADIEAKVKEVQREIESAQREGDTTEANRLYLIQQQLYGRLPGGSEPLVGSQGRVV